MSAWFHCPSCDYAYPGGSPSAQQHMKEQHANTRGLEFLPALLSERQAKKHNRGADKRRLSA